MRKNNIYIPSFTPNLEFQRSLEELLITKDMNIPIYFNYQDFFDSYNFMDEMRYRFELLTSDEEVDLYCYSMGVNLGLILASQYDNIRNLILMSAPIKPLHLTQNLRDLGSAITGDLNFDITNYSDEYASNKSKQMRKNTTLHRLLLFQRSLLLAKQSIKNVKTPTILIAGQKDAFVSPKGSRYIYDRINGRTTLVEIENGRHPVLLSSKRQMVVDEIESFLQEENVLIKTKKVI